MNPKIAGLIIIAFASVLFVDSNNDNNGGAKKTDPATQTIEQKGDENHEGMAMMPRVWTPCMGKSRSEVSMSQI